MSLDEVISFLTTNGLEGVLTVCGSLASLRLHFQDGSIICPTAQPKRRSGRIDRGSLAAILSRGAELSKTSDRLRKVKVDASTATSGKKKPSRRSLPPDALQKILARAEELDRQAVARAIEELIHEVLTWHPARFEFEPGKLPPLLLRQKKQGETIGLDPNSILMESARRRDSTSRFTDREKKAPLPAEWQAASDLHGDLEGIGLAAVLQSLNTQRRSGTLAVFTGGQREELFFKGGEAFVLIREQEDENDFAKQLLGESWVDRVELAHDFHKARAGLVSESDLTEAELRAVKDKFLEVLFWDDAEFVFQHDELPDDFHVPGDQVSKVALQTQRFLLEAIQRLTEWDGIRKVIGGRYGVLDFLDFERKMSTSATMSGRSLQVMTFIDGRLSFDEIVRLSGLEFLEVGRVVRELVEGGHLQVTATDPG